MIEITDEVKREVIEIIRQEKNEMLDQNPELRYMLHQWEKLRDRCCGLHRQQAERVIREMQIFMGIE